MESFTPYSALAGGALIGAAATLLLLLNGRVAGVSGVFFGLVAPLRGDVAWRAMFVLGLILGAVLYRGADTASAITIGASLPVLIAGGVLAGFGTRVSGGCTSGHGVCGISLLSVRSMVATLTFMLSAGVAVYVTRHVVGG